MPFNNENRNPNERLEHTSYENLSDKWVSAENLKAGDKVLLSNGKYGIIIKTEIKKLEEPEVTYNFEVADYHTYYVGKEGILVHNCCNVADDVVGYSDDFTTWLNKGNANNTVYKGIAQNGDEVYTGITRQNLSARLAQHNSLSGGAKNFKRLDGLYSNLTRNQARAIETYLINQNQGINAIRSVGMNNRFYSEAMTWAGRFLGG